MAGSADESEFPFLTTSSADWQQQIATYCTLYLVAGTLHAVVVSNTFTAALYRYGKNSAIKALMRINVLDSII